MDHQPFKTEVFDQLARIGKAVGHGRRLELLEFLAQGERTVEDLARIAHLSVANTSQHLQVLRHAELVVVRRAGRKSYYQLSGDDVIALMGMMRKIAENHLAKLQTVVEAYVMAHDTLEPVSASELIRRMMHEHEVTVLDVRPEEEFRAGHLPGAINIPLRDLTRHRHDVLNQDREIVAYCRGPYCVLAFEAVALLRQQGFRAKRLKEGFPEWRLAGLPVV